MMSLATIHRENQKVAEKAAKRGKKPYVPFNKEEVDRWNSIPFPDLGSYVPFGWELTGDTWFVDMTGFGGDYEPALTAEQFKNELRVFIAENFGVGFAISEKGQFQCYVSAYRKVDNSNDEEIKTHNYKIR